jgi:hypothetical protein
VGTLSASNADGQYLGAIDLPGRKRGIGANPLTLHGKASFQRIKPAATFAVPRRVRGASHAAVIALHKLQALCSGDCLVDRPRRVSAFRAFCFPKQPVNPVSALRMTKGIPKEIHAASGAFHSARERKQDHCKNGYSRKRNLPLIGSDDFAHSLGKQRDQTIRHKHTCADNHLPAVYQKQRGGSDSDHAMASHTLPWQPDSLQFELPIQPGDLRHIYP